MIVSPKNKRKGSKIKKYWVVEGISNSQLIMFCNHSVTNIDLPQNEHAGWGIIKQTREQRVGA